MEKRRVKEVERRDTFREEGEMARRQGKSGISLNGRKTEREEKEGKGRGLRALIF